MTNPYKPAAYTSLAPYLIVEEAEATVAFLEDVFSAELLRVYQHEDGSLMHAELRIDDTVLMLANAAEQWPAQPANVHIYVPDVDATFAKAVEAGATIVQEPVQKGDPDKRGGATFGGVTWWVATQVGEPSGVAS